MHMLQPVAALAFANGGRLLLSGGEDALAHAWLLLEALDAELPADRCLTECYRGHLAADALANKRTDGG
jgi:hypothetical protein